MIEELKNLIGSDFYRSSDIIEEIANGKLWDWSEHNMKDFGIRMYEHNSRFSDLSFVVFIERRTIIDVVQLDREPKEYRSFFVTFRHRDTFNGLALKDYFIGIKAYDFMDAKIRLINAIPEFRDFELKENMVIIQNKKPKNLKPMFLIKEDVKFEIKLNPDTYKQRRQKKKFLNFIDACKLFS